MKGSKLFKRLISVITVFCFLVTAGVGIFCVAYSHEVSRFLQVGFLLKTQPLHNLTMKQIMEGAAQGMVETLEDPYSMYMSNEKYQSLQSYIQGSIGGIGVYIDVKEDKLVVVSPIEGTPAYKAGIQSEDIIMKIDDVLTSKIQYNEAVAMMRGEPGTPVKISVMRDGEKELLEFNLTREEIEVSTVASAVLPDNKDIGYMRINHFASNTDEAVVEELNKLRQQNIKALILDVRNNPGGDLNSAVNIAKQFIPSGPLVYTVNRTGKLVTYAMGEGLQLNMPLAVLIDGGSASASEVLSGAIKDTKTGILIGEKSFGKGIVQGVYPLTGGEGMTLTTAKYLTPNKIDIHEKGIEPDIHVEFTEQNIKDQEDVQLNKAVEVLQEQLQ